MWANERTPYQKGDCKCTAFVCLFVSVCLNFSSLPQMSSARFQQSQHWGFFKVSLAQSAMNYWAWASPVPVRFAPLLTPSFFSQVWSLWHMTSWITNNDGATLPSIPAGEVFFACNLFNRKVTVSNTDQGGIQRLPQSHKNIFAARCCKFFTKLGQSKDSCPCFVVGLLICTQ